MQKHMLPFQIDPNVWGYWKRGTFIILTIFILTLFAIAIAFVSWKGDYSYFMTHLQSSDLLTSIKSIVAVAGFIGAYLYLLFYLEQHHAFILKEDNKEAKLGVQLFMAYRLLNYLVLFLLIYFVFVSKAYLQAGIVAGLFLVTTLVFIPISENFAAMICDYKILETLEPRHLLESTKSMMEIAQGDLGNLHKKVKERKQGESRLQGLLGPYVPHVPTLLYGVVWIMIQKGTPHLKNSTAILTFLSVFLMFPFGFNPIVIAYTVLTLIFWFWMICVVFVGFPVCKLNIHLKNGKEYKEVYKVEDNPAGYCLYLDSGNTLIRVENTELEKELPLNTEKPSIPSLPRPVV